MINIDLCKIHEVCLKNPIGYEQMGYIYPRIMKYITQDNQDKILDVVGVLANKGLNKYQIVEKIAIVFENNLNFEEL